MRKLAFSPTTRLFHFLFASFVLIAYFTSDGGEFLWLHASLGIAIIFLVLFRIIWLFSGENGAKIGSFDLHVRSLKEYLLNYFNYEDTKLRNPAASYAAVVMWIMAVLTSIVGLVFIGIRYSAGVFGDLGTTQIDAHMVKEIHSVLGNILIATAGVHVIGVLAENFLKKSSIIKAMVDGKMKTEHEEVENSRFQFSKLLAFSVGIVAIGFTGYISWNQQNMFLSSKSAHQDYALTTPTMHKECTSCHMFYPPNLTNKGSQLTMLDNLSNHFGTDASLDDNTLKLVKDEVEKLAPKTTSFQLEENGRSLHVNESMTTTPRWKHKHEEFNDAWFKENKIKKTDCKVCHQFVEKGTITPFELNRNKFLNELF